ncbi:hypothetical protein KGY71_01750 [Candidatus Bipolaricaulota bacterium]|nr:hypothetical protein [Candidatus Bipolaricaulota bacterium]
MPARIVDSETIGRARGPGLLGFKEEVRTAMESRTSREGVGALPAMFYEGIGCRR